MKMPLVISQYEIEYSSEERNNLRPVCRCKKVVNRNIKVDLHNVENRTKVGALKIEKKISLKLFVLKSI